MPKQQCSPYPDLLQFNKNLEPEQKMVMETVRNFVTEEAQESIVEANRTEEFPLHLGKEMGKLGLLGANLKGYGLPGMDSISYGLIMRELERCDSALRSFASVQGALAMYAIHSFGSEEQKKHWLPKMAKAEAIGCFCLSESTGGSDPGAMTTKAEKKGKSWFLSGSKMWITNGQIADVAVVWAQTEAGIRGFLISPQNPAVKKIKMSNKLSLRASITSEFYFDKLELTEDSILPKSEGLKSALSCLSQARYGISWGVLGAAEACFDEVCRFTADRKLFSDTLNSKQLVQFKLATMFSEITRGQALAFRVGQLKNEGKLHYSHISFAKQANCQMALNVARTARDILGGHGIMDEYSSMRHMANLETVITYEGTNDIHLMILGQEITGKTAF